MPGTDSPSISPTYSEPPPVSSLTRRRAAASGCSPWRNGPPGSRQPRSSAASFTNSTALSARTTMSPMSVWTSQRVSAIAESRLPSEGFLHHDHPVGTPRVGPALHADTPQRLLIRREEHHPPRAAFPPAGGDRADERRYHRRASVPPCDHHAVAAPRAA